MDKEKVAKELVDFFYTAHANQMPKDPKERLRVETMIKSKVFTEMETGYEEQRVIDEVLEEIETNEAVKNSWFGKLFRSSRTKAS